MNYLPIGAGGGSTVVICPLLLTAADFFLPPVVAGLLVVSRSTLWNEEKNKINLKNFTKAITYNLEQITRSNCKSKVYVFYYVYISQLMNAGERIWIKKAISKYNS